MRIGALIASGRDCFIFESEPGRVVRRARDGRSLEREASVMRHARRHGFPAPQVFAAAGPDILMERVDGIGMIEEVVARPQCVQSHGALLAELHRKLAAVRAPGWLPAAEGCIGNSLLHLDLHPLNVLITADGPRVIDWANAARGPAGADVANTWLTMATASVEEPYANGLRLLLDSFLDHVDRADALPYLLARAESRCADRHTLDVERASIERLVESLTAA